MKFFNDLTLKFQRSDWSKTPELGLIDTVLDQNPEMVRLLSNELSKGGKSSDFGRKDSSRTGCSL